MRETVRILPRPQDFILKFSLEEIHSTDELGDDLASLFDLPSGADLSRNRSQFRPTAMDAKIREFFDAVGDSITWCERESSLWVFPPLASCRSPRRGNHRLESSFSFWFPHWWYQLGAIYLALISFIDARRWNSWYKLINALYLPGVWERGRRERQFGE